MGQRVDINDPNMTVMRAQSDKDEQSGRVNSAHDFMENAMNDAQSIMGMLGGILKGILGIFGKGGGGKGG